MIYSKFHLKILFLFLILVTAFRFLLIYQDEPDWGIRISELINNQYIGSFIKYLASIPEDYFFYNCEILFEIDIFFFNYPLYCNQDFFVNIARIFFTFLIALPIFLLILFKYKTTDLNFSKKYEYQDINRILDAISITLIFPGTIYYLGLISHESFFISISLLSIYFMRRVYLCVCFITLLFFIDQGNASVITFTLIFFLFLYIINNKIITIIISASLLILLYNNGVNLIYKISDQLLFFDIEIDFLNKRLFDYTYIFPDIIDKYPLFYRPIFSFMSLILFYPSGLKGFFSYIYVTINIIFFLVKLIRNFSNDKSKNTYIYGVTPIVCILFFIFILPTYTNFKYYIFLLPFFFYYLLSYYSRNSLIKFSLTTSLLVIIDIIIFRGIWRN